MSLWCCEKCQTLQGFNAEMLCCQCGGLLAFATIHPSQVSQELETVSVSPSERLIAAVRYWQAKKLAVDAVRPMFTSDQMRELVAAEGRLLSVDVQEAASRVVSPAQPERLDTKDREGMAVGIAVAATVAVRLCIEKARFIALASDAFDAALGTSESPRQDGSYGWPQGDSCADVASASRAVSPAQPEKPQEKEPHMKTMKFVEEWNTALNCAAEWPADCLDGNTSIGGWIARVTNAGNALAKDYEKVVENMRREAHLAVLLRQKLHEVAGPEVASSVNV